MKLNIKLFFKFIFNIIVRSQIKYFRQFKNKYFKLFLNFKNYFYLLFINYI
jgi:hypothetical protein